MSEQEEKKVQVNLPVALHDRLAERMKGTAFSNVDDFIAYILEMSIGNRDQAVDRKDESQNKEDDEKVLSRLRDLGYI
jgi:Arc/MetJ-type ribon-helix-helix transcriptional regulator